MDGDFNFTLESFFCFHFLLASVLYGADVEMAVDESLSFFFHRLFSFFYTGGMRNEMHIFFSFSYLLFSPFLSSCVFYVSLPLLGFLHLMPLPTTQYIYEMLNGFPGSSSYTLCLICRR